MVGSMVSFWWDSVYQATELVLACEKVGVLELVIRVFIWEGSYGNLWSQLLGMDRSGSLLNGEGEWGLGDLHIFIQVEKGFISVRKIETVSYL